MAWERFDGIERVRLEVWAEVRRRWETPAREGVGERASVYDLNRRWYGASSAGDAAEEATRSLRAHVLGELVHAGILRESLDRGDMYVVTPHGARCLAAGDPAFPLDSTGRVDSFTAEFAGAPGVDLMARYLAESIEAYRHGLDLAGATMIGCAYELAILRLADAVLARWGGQAAVVPGLDKDQKRVLERHGKPGAAAVADLEDAVFAALAHDKTALGDHWDWAESAFRATFALVRKLRNKAGHPTGARVPRDDVFTHIVLLPEWYRHVRAVQNILAGLTP